VSIVLRLVLIVTAHPGVLMTGKINNNTLKNKIMRVTIKDVITSDNWIITEVTQGSNKDVRINAKTRNRIADGVNHFSQWCKETYANRLSNEVYGKRLTDFRCYRY
jgi:hypothetical protein